jgi:predicted ATPase/DNA-binding SARP family transcriptional activator
LFKLLLSAPNLRLARDQLCDVLWPEADARQAANRLRRTLFRLRRALDPADTPPERSYIRLSRDLIELLPAGDADPPSDWLDATAFVRAAEAALNTRVLPQATEALALYSGDYLPEEPYEDWAIQTRDLLSDIRDRLLFHVVSLAQEVGDRPLAERLLGQRLAANPADERAALALMQLLGSVGRRAAALRVYDGAAASLPLELGPSRELRELRAEIVADRIAVSAPSGSLPTRPPPPPPPPPSSLPRSAGRLVGRHAELAEISRALHATRLLTIAGPGGVGKTRTVIELAHALRPSFAGGVAFLDLSGLTDAAFIPVAILAASNIPEEPGRNPLATLIDCVNARSPLLLVLDGAELLRSDLREQVAALLDQTSGLTLVVTSRAPLRLPDEHVFRLAGLPLPAGEHLAAVAASDAAQLLVDRARAMTAQFQVSRETAPVIAQLCHALDGLPLALELAAARLSVLSPAELLTRLADRFETLTDGQRAVPSRHRSLRATMEWSCRLLTPSEQAVLRRLAVFAGGCSLRAAETVCAGPPITTEVEVLDALAVLVDQSLVQADMSGPEARYRLLETVRAYGEEMLRGAGELDSTRAAHGRHFVVRSEEYEAVLLSRFDQRCVESLQGELDNMRSAMRCAHEDGDISAALRIATAMWRFWILGHEAEGRLWLERLISDDRSRQTPTELLSKALGKLGLFRYATGDRIAAIASLEQSLDVSGRAAGPDQEFGLTTLGFIALDQGDYDRATLMLDRAFEFGKETAGQRNVPWVIRGKAAVALAMDDITNGVALAEQAASGFEATGDVVGRSFALLDLGEAYVRLGDMNRGRRVLEEALELRRALSEPNRIAVWLCALGRLAIEEAQHVKAFEVFREAVSLCHDNSDTMPLALAFEGLCRALHLLGRDEQSASFAGAADILRADSVTQPSRLERRALDATIAALREHLSSLFDGAWERGATIVAQRANFRSVVAAMEGSPLSAGGFE